MSTVALDPATAAEGPALSVADDRLASSLSCPGRFAEGREPVLLVHGTATNSHDTWSWNYLRAVPAFGVSVCTVELPDRALGDIQVSAEYVVHAIRAVSAASGKRVDVIGHSQGSLEPGWAPTSSAAPGRARRRYSRCGGGPDSWLR